jgi:hypothetical protein
MSPGTYADVGEAAWRWVLDQVRWDDGPWIPESVPHVGGPPEERDGMHSGVGGLAHVLAEVRKARAWTDEEATLAHGIAERIRARLRGTTEYNYFDGLISDLGVLTALGEDGAAEVVARLGELATDTGWEQQIMGPPVFPAETRINDVTLGTAGVVLGAVWAHRHGTPGAAELASRAADLLLAEGEPTAAGTFWKFVPERFRGGVPPENRRDMPNWSHGTAGIAAALAVAGSELGRHDLVGAARAGAEHLVTLGDASDGGFVVPHYIPPHPDADEVTYGWCHGPTGTSLLFTALERAGVADVAGETPRQWQHRCLRSLRTSGIPERLHPGFWDNDGRCCGTAGVGDVVLDAWQRHGEDDDLAFARVLGDALVERAVVDGDRACWRFVEHRNADPRLPPGVGWMQGAAGIAAYLMRLARVLREGRTTPAVARLDTWWNLP